MGDRDSPPHMKGVSLRQKVHVEVEGETLDPIASRSQSVILEDRIQRIRVNLNYPKTNENPFSEGRPDEDLFN